MVDQEKIKGLLGLNLPNNVVASAVGVSESRIAQLMSDETFAAEVQELKIKNLEASAERDSTYNSIEDKLLHKLEDLVDNPLFGNTNPALLLNAIRTINAAKRRATPAELTGVSARQVVPLIMPAIIAENFIVNFKNQVVEVGGRSIATMPASRVVKQLEEMRKNGAAESPQQILDMENAQDRLRKLVKMESLEVQELHTQL